MDQFHMEKEHFLFKGHFNCIEDLRERDLKWKYFINLCGDDFPIKTSSGWVS